MKTIDDRKARIRTNRSRREHHQLAMMVSESRRRALLMLLAFVLFLAWLCLAVMAGLLAAADFPLPF